ncbi:phosphoribosyltransferase family protein [Rhodococcus sp. HNM0569]|uniref:phosphoribosyltransferase n=1 Tax=Rhodococcus sp. HNM0569 TaxID=2716340 RepID=UPI00146E34CE|nr:phosphoribosyltransferase family protein [Rhodococcus sp. HNM0569]NLU83922.1 phosphoribosyltransferase [Rhodococcus sp. HNM0569]
MRYADRSAAGRELAAALEHLRGTDPLVLALPRGGVPVAREVADALDATLDVALVRKLGVPWHSELAMGAIGEHGSRVFNDDVLASVRVSERDLAAVERAERAELERRARVLRGDAPAADPAGRTVIVVDDGIATGATALAACRDVAEARARRIVVAAPVAIPSALRWVAAHADEVVCPHTPDDIGGVGAAYDDFHQLSDDEVRRLLAPR